MKDIKKYKLNLKPSPFDPRDYKVESLRLTYTFPETLDLRTSMFDVRDQGYQGSCAAMSGAAIKDWQEIVDINIDEYMSPQFIYNNREDLNEEGMYLRDLMKILSNKGTCKESTHPYGNLNTPSTTAYEEAKKYIISDYANISTIDALKQALYESGPCVIAVPVYNYTNRMWFKRPTDDFLGGHAMTVVGYNEDGFIIRNSWGNDWNGDGHTIFPYEDWGMQWEVWSAIDAESDPSDPDPDPEPDPEIGCLKSLLVLLIPTYLLISEVVNVLL